jgi:hypothetical protein
MARALALLLGVALALSGCVALPLAPILAAGAGGVVQAGTQATLAGGTAYRTFTVPVDQLLTAVHTTLQRMEITIGGDDVDGGTRTISAEVGNRIIHVTLERITSTVTRLGVVIYQGGFTKDVATASEIVAQTERTLKAGGAASR